MIKLTIDNKKITVDAGKTILEAALENGIYIPNLCWDRRLKPYGGCRMCVIEVEGQARLFAACSTPCENGMVILTDTPTLRDARKTLLELLLVHHPLDCPICDKAGECTLQDFSYKYGQSESRFYGARKDAPEDTGSPLIERNPNRCIQCGKCVRICWEHQGVGAINFIGRGFETKISPAFEETLDCEFCGQCVDVCPVGALGSKPFKYSARAWFLDSHDTICPYCGVGCTVTIDTMEGRIRRSRGIQGKGINRGDLCSKGRYGIDFIYAENRLKTPLIRKDGELKETSWEEALYYIAERLTRIKGEKGSDRIGAIGSPRITIEDNYMLQKFIRNVLGSNNIDSSARFGYARIEKAIEMAFGLKSLPISMSSPLNKDVILVVDSDISSTHPVWALRFLEAKRDGANLIVAESRETKLSRHSSAWLRIRPGTSQTFLNGIMKIALDEGLGKDTSKDIPNFSEFTDSLREYTPEKVSEITGINKDELIKSAREFFKAENRLLAITLGPAENNKGLNTLLSASNLIILTGDGPSALQMPAEYSNTYGIWQMGIAPYILPGYKKIEDNPGKDILSMLYKKDEIDALYIMGEDPLLTLPDSRIVEDTLKGIELIIVQDIRLTETARYANVVLPAAAWAEKDGTFINSSGIPQPVYKIVSPPGNTIPDWQIFRNLARVMNTPIGADNLNSLRDEIGKIKIEKGEEKWVFNPTPLEEKETTDEGYPFLMITGNLMQHSGTFSIMSKGLSHVLSDAFIQINEEDAEEYGLEDGNFAQIESRRGSTTTKVRITDEVMKGMIFVPIHFPHARINELTQTAKNGNIPITAVRITPE